jgi:hypothetical protein
MRSWRRRARQTSKPSDVLARVKRPHDGSWGGASRNEVPVTALNEVKCPRCHRDVGQSSRLWSPGGRSSSKPKKVLGSRERAEELLAKWAELPTTH